MGKTWTAALLVAISCERVAWACTSIAIGREASATGYPIVTHSDDSGPHTTDIRLIRVPRKRWPAGSMRPLYYWEPGYPRIVDAELSPEYAPVGSQKETVPIGYIPQVPVTWAYWDTDYGIQNEKGLSIGESTCTAKTVGWPAMPGKPYGYNRAGIEDLSKIALERCSTARCAIETMGTVAVEQGFYSADSGAPNAPAYGGSSECLSIADAKEVWIFNVLTGRGNASAIWAAQQVPPNHIAPIGNAFTIRKMNLSDSNNFLYSAGITDLAVEMGWWTPKGETSAHMFDFFGAYGYTPPPEDPTLTILEFYSGRRMWRVWNLLSPEQGSKLDPDRGQLPHTKDPYPLSLPAPKGSVTVQMVMDVHRDHYEGTPYDLTKGMPAGPFGTPNRWSAPVQAKGQWERAIAMYRTSWSHVVEAKPNGRGITWFGYDCAHGTAYLPFYGAALMGAPEAWHSHEGSQSKFSNKVAWWAFNLVNQYSDLNFGLINKEVRAKAHAIESEAFRAVALWEEQVAELSDIEALQVLTKKSNDFAEAKLAEWWDLLPYMWAKFGRYVVTFNESEIGGEDAKGQAYPMWWLRSADVGFSSWSRDGPYHGVPDHAAATDAVSLLVGQENRSIGFLAVALLVLLSHASLAAAMYFVGLQRGRRSMEAMDCYVSHA